MKNKIKKLRRQKWAAQKGRCYYCGQPMWEDCADRFRRKHGVSHRFARLFQSTAEHLTARSAGGADTAGNIVAACLYCNQTRHAAKRPLDPENYRKRVMSRLERGAWTRLNAESENGAGR
ncbi:HNH endonuclease [Antarctobacter jejuensis]|uniref:HNH endonuclease n=1 Tax=Antarctobacter jejuensis TaxID=1439938 RepID=UPI003FCF0AB9